MIYKDLMEGDTMLSRAHRGAWLLRVEKHSLNHVRWLTTLNLRTGKVSKASQDGTRPVSG